MIEPYFSNEKQSVKILYTTQYADRIVGSIKTAVLSSRKPLMGMAQFIFSSRLGTLYSAMIFFTTWSNLVWIVHILTPVTLLLIISLRL